MGMGMGGYILVDVPLATQCQSDCMAIRWIDMTCCPGWHIHGGSHSFKNPKSVRATNLLGPLMLGTTNWTTNCGPLKITEHSGDFVEFKGPHLRVHIWCTYVDPLAFFQSSRMGSIVQFSGPSCWHYHHVTQ